jgi:hypothetical protein
MSKAAVEKFSRCVGEQRPVGLVDDPSGKRNAVALGRTHVSGLAVWINAQGEHSGAEMGEFWSRHIAHTGIMHADCLYDYSQFYIEVSIHKPCQTPEIKFHLICIIV